MTYSMGLVKQNKVKNQLVCEFTCQTIDLIIVLYKFMIGHSSTFDQKLILTSKQVSIA